MRVEIWMKSSFNKIWILLQNYGTSPMSRESETKSVPVKNKKPGMAKQKDPWKKIRIPSMSGQSPLSETSRLITLLKTTIISCEYIFLNQLTKQNFIGNERRKTST